MKKLLLTLTLATSLTAANIAYANTNKEKQEVETAFQNWQKSLSSGKAENVVNLYDKEAILLATLAEKPILNQQDRTKYFEGLVSKPKMAVKVTEEHAKILDEDNAVLSGLYTFSFEQDGKKVEIPARYSFVYEKKDGKWMILEHHSSKVPANN